MVCTASVSTNKVAASTKKEAHPPIPYQRVWRVVYSRADKEYKQSQRLYNERGAQIRRMNKNKNIDKSYEGK